jgi:hypothetical protein
MLRRFLGLLVFSLLACRSSTPAEPVKVETPDVAQGPRPPSTHVIVREDHRNLLKIALGDYIELPHDAAYEWSIRFENHSYFDPAPASDAGVERYKATRTGIVQTKVDGDPKECMHTDAACTIAKYEWSVNIAIE